MGKWIELYDGFEEMKLKPNLRFRRLAETPRTPFKYYLLQYQVIQVMMR